MRIGRHTKHVHLFRGPQVSGDSDGYGEALDPPDAWCSIEPQGPVGDGRTVGHLITMRWHKQVTMDCWLVYADPVLDRDRQFKVMGIQNVNERNVELRLVCEEVIP